MCTAEAVDVLVKLKKENSGEVICFPSHLLV